MSQAGGVKTAGLFTPESANRALPYVRAVVDDLVDAYHRIRRAEEARARALAGRVPPGTGSAEEAVRDADDARRTAREDLARVALELERAGVELKDPETGLVDFPGELEGRRVYLCWRRGEERVAWFHEVEAGVRGRRPLPGIDSGEDPDG